MTFGRDMGVLLFPLRWDAYVVFNCPRWLQSIRELLFDHLTLSLYLKNSSFGGLPVNYPSILPHERN